MITIMIINDLLHKLLELLLFYFFFILFVKSQMIPKLLIYSQNIQHRCFNSHKIVPQVARQNVISIVAHIHGTEVCP